MADMSPITIDEAEAFAGKFTGWTQQLTDRERVMLGMAIATIRDEPGGALSETASSAVGPAIAATLAAVAAMIVMIGQIEAKALEDQAAAKEREAGVKDAARQQLGRVPPDRGIQSARRRRDLGLPDDG